MGSCHFVLLSVVLLAITSSALSSNIAVPSGVRGLSSGNRRLLSTTASSTATPNEPLVFRQDEEFEDRIAGPRERGTLKRIGDGNGKGKHYAQKAAEHNKWYQKDREEFDANRPDHSKYYDGGKYPGGHSKKPRMMGP